MDSQLNERVERERQSHTDSDVLGKNRRFKNFFWHTVCSPTMRRLEKDFARTLGEVNGKRVMEIGCARGEHCFPLLDAGAVVAGIDISPKFITEATGEAARRGYDKHQYDFRVMDAHALKYDNESIDLIIGRGVLHHLDLQIALSEIRRVLKPGGSAVFLEPLAANPLLKLFRLITPKARTIDEKPLSAKDLKVIETEWVSHSRFYGVVSAPIAVVTSIVLRPFDNNIFLLAADWAEQRLNRAKLLHAYNQYVLLNLVRAHD